MPVNGRDPAPSLGMVTGFFIPTGDAAGRETDGPLGRSSCAGPLPPRPAVINRFVTRHPARAIAAGTRAVRSGRRSWSKSQRNRGGTGFRLHRVGRVRVRANAAARDRAGGPASDGGLYTMRGRDISRETLPLHDRSRNATRTGGPSASVTAATRSAWGRFRTRRS